jgi:hypothetical protein
VESKTQFTSTTYSGRAGGFLRNYHNHHRKRRHHHHITIKIIKKQPTHFKYEMKKTEKNLFVFILLQSSPWSNQREANGHIYKSCSYNISEVLYKLMLFT